MKKQFRAMVFLTICLQLISCGQAIPATQPPIETATSTITPSPSEISASTIEPSPRPTYVLPTLIPTIDPALLSDLLNNALSIESFDIDGLNGQRITGWELGYSGLSWLDSNHLILYPASGQASWGETDQAISVVTQIVVINIDTGHFWSLPSNKLDSPFDYAKVRWSPKLNILITWEPYGDMPSVSTYTYDGQKLASYPGKMSSISPSRTKVILDDNILIDLQTGEKIKLDWSREDYYEPISWDLFWTSDETRIYRCCYFYADLLSGTSFRFTESDFQDSQGNPLVYDGLWMYKGEWVRDDIYFLVWWSYLDDGDIRYLPMIDPSKKVFYDVREMAGISPELTCYDTDASSDGKYLWVNCSDVNYLIHLFDFETTTYPGYTQVDIHWSSDSQFAWLAAYNLRTNETDIEILSLSNKEIKSLPIMPSSDYAVFWHPTDNVLIYPAKDKNVLVFLDAAMLTYRELPFQVQNTQSEVDIEDWSPNEEKLIFITDNHTLWQVDYPSLENLQQIMTSSNTIGRAEWSPDGNSISFVSGKEIYIIEPNHTTP
ncbi:MAG: hypothetical protein IT315_01195 [Anaerolineales bacterium]|nr:hypothetical protein [Anaerolineales bacterium]